MALRQLGEVDFGFTPTIQNMFRGPQVAADPVETQQQTVQRLTNTHVGVGGGQPETTKPGVLERVFDVLLRPNYAVAETASRLLDDENGGLTDVNNWWDAIQGGGQGLAGREKTSFSQVLDEQGVENKWIKGVGGFALDVLLDPTTYLSGGLSAGKKLKDAAKLGQTLSNVGKGRAIGGPTGVLFKRIDEAMEMAKNTPIAQADILDEVLKSKGITSVTDLSQKEFRAAAKEAKDKLQSRRIDEAGTLVRQGADGTPAIQGAERELLPDIELRFMGKRIAGIQEPVGMHEMRQRFFNSRRAGNNAAMLFSTRHRLPDGMNDMWLQHSGKMTGWAQDTARQYRKAIKPYKLSQSELEHVGSALDAGIAPGIEKLDEVFEITRSLFDEMWDLELAMGLHKKGNKKKGYVPHIYRKTEDFHSDVSRSVRSFGGEPRLKASQVRQFDTLEDAARAGYEPTRNIEVLIGHRLADHQQAMARAHFLEDVRVNFGVLPRDVTVGDAEFIADLPKNIGGIVGTTKKDIRSTHAKYAKMLKENGFVDGTKFRVFDGATGEVKKVEYLLPQRIKDSLANIERITTDSRSANEFLQAYDRVHGLWKAWATVMNPGHHTRNQIGDFFMSWEGGAMNPVSYFQSMKTIMGDKDIPRWLANVKPELLENMPKTRKIKLGSQPYDDLQLYRWYRAEGLGTGFYRAETTESNLRMFEAARRVAGGREDVTRFAHFIEKMKQYAAKHEGPITNTVEKQWREQAARSVRKWHIDYSDVTPFEQDVIKRFSSFYTFMRKNLPLQLETLALQPGKLATVPKGIHAVQELLGTSDIDARIENRIPDWMREAGNILINNGDGEDDPRTLNLALPVQEAFDRFSGILSPTAGEGTAWDRAQGGARELANASNPLFKSVAELATGRSTFTGGPIDEDLGQFVSNLIPSGRVLGGLGAFGQEADPRRTELLTNWLSGIGTQTATAPRQEAELRRQEDVLRVLLEQLGVA